MEEKRVLAQLTELVSQLGLEVRWEDGDFTGGVCRVEESQLCIINRTLPNSEKVQVLCRSLRKLDLSQVFVLPKLRDLIDGKSDL